MPHKKKLNDEYIKRANELYANGYSYRKIEREFAKEGVFASHETIGKSITVGRPATDIQKAKAVDPTGKTIEQIAIEAGVSKTTALKAFPQNANYRIKQVYENLKKIDPTGRTYASIAKEVGCSTYVAKKFYEGKNKTILVKKIPKGTWQRIEEES